MKLGHGLSLHVSVSKRSDAFLFIRNRKDVNATTYHFVITSSAPRTVNLRREHYSRIPRRRLNISNDIETETTISPMDRSLIDVSSRTKVHNMKSVNRKSMG